MVRSPRQDRDSSGCSEKPLTKAGAGLGCSGFTLTRSSRISGLIHGVLGLVAWSSSWAQEIPRDSYLHYLPLSYPKLMPQTAASAELHLYGDPTAPSYCDLDPVDGVDDDRQHVLQALAVRFAPYLVQNTASVPVDFRQFVANRDAFALHVDTWDVGDKTPSLVDRDAVNLSLLGQAECDRNAVAGPAREDCKMLALLSLFSPGGEVARDHGSRVRMRPELFRVLYFDFPGEGPSTWKRVYEEEYLRTDPVRRNAFPTCLRPPLHSHRLGFTRPRPGLRTGLAVLVFLSQQ